jgi:hypothetical protein
MQTAVCNKAHRLEPRLARWLVLTGDASRRRHQCDS